MKISNYLQFINEDLVSDLSTKISDKNKDIKEDLVKMIQKSINSEDPKLFSDFIDSFVRNPEDSQIEGLINGLLSQLIQERSLDEIIGSSGFLV